MASVRLVDRDGVMFLQIMEGNAVLGRASMGRKELEEAARRFDQAARILESREQRPEKYRGLRYWLPSPSRKVRWR